ncbi:MAG: hypothetical protein HRT43_00570 [Campylobacteraceae bacterium]|nr:hypothetical protein [Campylobacteraceae bacterium]
MSSATETINKLSEALNTLIKAYEELQTENNGLQSVITQLKADKSKLEDEKNKAERENNNLQNNLNTLSDNSEEQNSSMYNMLDKIELLLSKEVAMPTYEKKDEPKDVVLEDNRIDESQKAVDEEVSTLLADEKPEPAANTENKIDLNRMASLLNGFNK